MLIGPVAMGLLQVNLIDSATLLEHLTEIAVVISLFAAGLKMRMPLGDARWLPPMLLATATMTVTVGLITLLGWWWLGLPIGMAVLLGAVLAPTDPVLASEVQVENPDDKDRLRLTLTAEAGLNDGTAFPFVLLAVGLIGLGVGQDLHPLGAYGWRWVGIDVAWRCAGGLLLGWFGGCWLARGAIWCRRKAKADIGSNEMLSLGLIALVYGAALLMQTYAFLAVFAAAVALRQRELAVNADQSEEEAIKSASKELEHPRDREGSLRHGDAPAILARDQMEVADALEKLVQVMLVVLVGTLILPTLSWDLTPWYMAAAILFVVRPVAVYLTVHSRQITPPQRALTAWFGIRGIGTLYYLTHAFGLGVAEALPQDSRFITDICLATITLSILLHGTSVTPLMRWYGKRFGD